MAFENLKKAGITYLLGKLKTYLDGTFLKIANAVRSVNGNEANEDGDITIVSVPYAQNLESESSKRVNSTFIQRTAGGDSSVAKGSAWLMNIKGNSTHDDYVPESLQMTVTALGDPPITATIDRDTFVSEVDESGTILLLFTTSWSADPATYGITVTGTPTAGDTITVVYVKEDRGNIAVTNPQSFVATGWNLYDHTNGYARVIKYDFGYRIDGTYSSLEFSSEIDGTRTEITVVDGSFDITGDGFVWVTDGTPTDTAIYMTWEDWTEEPDEEFQEYTESVIDLSGVMESKFPYGLLKAGSVVDEIDLNLGQTISRVERLAYSAENLASAIASGREYEYDTDYIYLERASAVVNYATINGAFTSNDHGIEFYPDQTVGIETETLYGVNLKNKLEREVLTMSQQNLTETQKSQVLKNLGAVGTMSQNLTTAQKSQARSNIDAPSIGDMAGKLSMWETSVEASSNKNVSLENNGRYLIAFNSTATTAKCMAIVSVNANGSVNAVKIGEASNISFDTSISKVLKVTNATTQNVGIFVLVLQ